MSALSWAPEQDKIWLWYNHDNNIMCFHWFQYCHGALVLTTNYLTLFFKKWAHTALQALVNAQIIHITLVLIGNINSLPLSWALTCECCLILTSLWSSKVIELIPAKTMFLATSAPRPPTPTRRMRAALSLKNGEFHTIDQYYRKKILYQLGWQSKQQGAINRSDFNKCRSTFTC